MATIISTEQSKRIVTLDIVRGIAVMGILAMNIVAFAMPPQAYINPLAYGADHPVDLAAYAFNFVLIDGKMRGLFSFLFGASMLLVAQMAEAKGESARSVTYRRLLWLLFFGMLHYYLVWYGDILIGYALVGMVAWFFRDFSARSLVRWGIALVAVQLLILSAFAFYNHSLSAAIEARTATPAMLEIWREMTKDVAVPSPALLKEELALFLGPWTGIVSHQLTEEAFMPFFFTFLFGWETLAYMLFGMAGLKSGFLTGTWDTSDYRRFARRCLTIGIPAYVALLALINLDRFSVPGLFTYAFAATVPFRPLMVAAYAAVAILATRRGGWLADRIAAAGRAAFTNYLGTSIVMTFIFYGWGLGLFGQLGRADLWPVVIGAWVLMLAWSKPWLDRFNYGPFEWLWRSLARWKLQPMRKRLPQGAVASGA
jgi:uncharacterized protein